MAVTTRHDGRPRASVINAAVVEHPVTGRPVVAFVSLGRVRKLADLRARPQATVIFRADWEWIAVEGDVQLAGPNDRLPGLDEADVLPLLGQIYAAAVGGTPEEWDELDARMRDERHTAVLLEPTRIYPTGGA
ncbi:MAG: putative F420-dependent enzyme [Actinomycetia bacterium]|nr:putative F420-dependent enzyme [Actinomycetes bacterium]